VGKLYAPEIVGKCDARVTVRASICQRAFGIRYKDRRRRRRRRNNRNNNDNSVAYILQTERVSRTLQLHGKAFCGWRTPIVVLRTKKYRFVRFVCFVFGAAAFYMSSKYVRDKSPCKFAFVVRRFFKFYLDFISACF